MFYRKLSVLLCVVVLSACSTNIGDDSSQESSLMKNNNAPAETPFEFPTLVPTYTPSPSELFGYVVIQGYLEDLTPEIFFADLQSQQIRQLTYGMLATDPKWSPDGSRIAFVSEKTGDSEIFIMDKDGRNLKRLTSYDGFDAQLSWSPDGNRIAFVSDREGGLNIHVFDLQTESIVQLTFGEYSNSDPDWSPDGKQIVFVSNREPGSGIFTINPDGSNMKKITKVEFQGYKRPVWGPNNRSIIFEKDSRVGDSELYIIDLETLEERPLAIERVDSSQAISWYASRSPERKYMLFSMFREDRFLLYVVDMENNAQYSLGLQGINADLYP